MITCTFENGNHAQLRHVVVHGIVEQNGALLLVRRAPGLLEGGKWSLPSGFLNRDETAGQGVLRELREETGWEGRVISLFFIKTDPNRPHEDRQNVALYFLIEPLKKRGEPDAESTDVLWAPIETLPDRETFAFDHGETVSEYLRYRSERFPLPIFV